MWIKIWSSLTLSRVSSSATTLYTFEPAVLLLIILLLVKKPPSCLDYSLLHWNPLAGLPRSDSEWASTSQTSSLASLAVTTGIVMSPLLDRSIPVILRKLLTVGKDIGELLHSGMYIFLCFKYSFSVASTLFRQWKPLSFPQKSSYPQRLNFLAQLLVHKILLNAMPTKYTAQ